MELQASAEQSEVEGQPHHLRSTNHADISNRYARRGLINTQDGHKLLNRTPAHTVGRMPGQDDTAEDEVVFQCS